MPRLAISPSGVRHLDFAGRVRAVIAVVLSLLTLPVASQASNIRCFLRDSGNYIYISGEIKPGDAKQFGLIKIDTGKRTAVVLDSLGGNLSEALQIGELIHSLHSATMVDGDTICASACALIWLAGDKRFFRATSRIGFHAAYVGSGSAVTESGLANALVGAYLTKLGLSYEAVAFVTSAPPNDMRWLTTSAAQRIGVSVDALDPPQAALPLPAIQMGQTASRTGEAVVATSKSYDDGRRARVGYENWFASLADNSYRDGVTFWAANRSNKPPPRCDGPGLLADARAGCVTARRFLDPVDARRQAEPDFRAGWNSL